MGEEPLHWSEKAKMTSPSMDAPASLQPRAPRSRSRKKAVLATGSILVVLAVVIAVIFVMLPSGADTGVAIGPTVPTTVGATVTTHAPMATTTTTTRPKQKSSVTSLYSRAGVFQDADFGISFEYPKSWVRVPMDNIINPDNPPAVAVGVADPKGAEYGGGPANYIIVMAGDLTKEEAARGAKVQLQEAIDHWESTAPEGASGKNLEAVTSTKVNGMQAAETIRQFTADGRTMVEKFCIVTSGRSAGFFIMCTEQKDRETNWPLFEATLESLQLGGTNTQT